MNVFLLNLFQMMLFGTGLLSIIDGGIKLMDHDFPINDPRRSKILINILIGGMMIKGSFL